MNRFDRWSSLPLSLSLSLSLAALLCVGAVACDGGSAGPRDTGGGSGAGGGGGSPAGAGTGGSSGAGGAVGTGGAGGAVGTGGSSGSGGSGPGAGGASGAGGGGRPDASASADAGAMADARAGSDVNQGALPNVTLHIAGDSTVMTYTMPTATADEGWGQELGQFLIAKVAIDNQAIGGASVESFHSSSRWTTIIGNIRAGDYVMAAFGANDSGTVAGRHVDPAAFQALFLQMADEVKAKQATFIPVTPSALQEWTGGKEGNTRLGPYVAATIAAGAMKNLPVDDLNARSVAYLNMIGQTAAMQIYKAGDKAHFTKMGATQMAQFVAEELQRIGSPLAAYLK